MNMGASLRIDGGTIVTPRGRVRAGIAVTDGIISTIGKESELPKSARTVDASGLHILPGVIDPHVHFRYLDTPLDESFGLMTRSAAAGGVTTVLPFIASLESIVAGLDIFKQIYEMAAYVDGSFHAIIFKQEQIREVGELIKQGISSFKFLLPYKGSEALPGVGDIDEGLIYLGMREIARHGAVAMVHCESPDLFFRLRDELLATEPRDAHWHDARPNACEAHGIATIAHLAKLTACPLYIVHVSIKEGGDLVRRARADGVRVWAETCPQYLSLTRFDTDKVWGKVNPPLRGKEDIEQLWREVGVGTIDTVGSDHCPLSPDEKQGLWHAKPGMPGIETMLPLMLSKGVNSGNISLERLVEVCCENPARIFGLYPRKGTIQVGADADLVLVDLGQEEKLDVKKMHDVYSYSAYDGWKVKGWPVMTVVRGEIVMHDGKITGQPGHGKFLQASLPSR
ncbi:MAG: dihydroorotase [Candidatus Abyssobacteria bacterium SURF_17]|uniref:Dihydroorotase n=1 Tax=Candidatus Abyssobacteria bacterium SURF_17 TaxID=2093361 RepID=A0A419F133_9BACT|nr:MAG: dihydroorotase [Candidatus Abyssubacteria bacterium SURF_17]